MLFVNNTIKFYNYTTLYCGEILHDHRERGEHMTDTIVDIDPTGRVTITWTSETQEVQGSSTNFSMAIARERLNKGAISMAPSAAGGARTLTFRFMLTDEWRVKPDEAHATISNLVGLLKPVETFVFRTNPEGTNSKE